MEFFFKLNFQNFFKPISRRNSNQNEKEVEPLCLVCHGLPEGAFQVGQLYNVTWSNCASRYSKVLQRFQDTGNIFCHGKQKKFDKPSQKILNKLQILGISVEPDSYNFYDYRTHLSRQGRNHR
jgi:hypothetical protein